MEETPTTATTRLPRRITRVERSTLITDPLTDNSGATGMDLLIAEVANEVFRKKQFIVREKDLERDGKIAEQFFKKMELEKASDEVKASLWIDDNCKNQLRKKHIRRRNNVHWKIKTTMESKCHGGINSSVVCCFSRTNIH